MAAHLSQVLYCVRVTMTVNESGQKDVILAIDVLGVLSVDADDGAVYDHRAGGKDALPVEDADVIERDFARGCCHWVLASCVVYCNCFAWVE